MVYLTNFCYDFDNKMENNKNRILQNLAETTHFHFEKKPLWQKYWEIGLIILLVAFCIALEGYFYISHEIKPLYSHFFYLPIALAALWYGLRGGVIVSFILAVTHILFFLPAQQLIDFSRAGSFVFIGIVLGVAVRKRIHTERELKRSYARLKNTQYKLVQAEKMEIVSRLASTIVHEVKNPLAIALEAAGYLSRKIDMKDPSIDKSMRYLKEAVKRADQIVVNLLDFSKMSYMEPKKCDINLLLQNSVIEHQPVLERLNIELTEDYYLGLPEIKVDVVKMKQVLLNILLNAIVAMPDGGHLDIRTYFNNEKIHIQIEDTGQGIPKEVLDKIYEPFFTTRKEKGGTGLGLWLVQHFMDIHGGNIIIINKEDGHGVSATLVFPAQI